MNTATSRHGEHDRTETDRSNIFGLWDDRGSPLETFALRHVWREEAPEETAPDPVAETTPHPVVGSFTPSPVATEAAPAAIAPAVSSDPAPETPEPVVAPVSAVATAVTAAADDTSATVAQSSPSAPAQISAPVFAMADFYPVAAEIGTASDSGTLSGATSDAATQTAAAALTPSPLVASSPATASASDPVSSAIGSNPLVVYNWNPSTQLRNFNLAVAAVKAGTPGASAKIIAVGDSTTAGFGSTPTNNNYDSASYPTDLAIDLTRDGLASQSDNFLGDLNTPNSDPSQPTSDTRITFVGAANWSGAYDAGAQTILTSAVGDGFNFTLATPHVYDRVDITYADLGSGTATLSIDGRPVTIQLGNTGNNVTTTVDLPLASQSVLNVVNTSGTRLFIEGVSFWNSQTPSVQVYNAGFGGAQSDVVGTGSSSGLGDIQGAVQIGANLALINFGINDILQHKLTAAQTTANLALMVAEFRSVNTDPIIIIPTPIGDPNDTNPNDSPDYYTTEISTLRADVDALAVSLNVPVIDLSATYNDDPIALINAGLLGNDYVHPTGALYADIASGIAGLLQTQTVSVVNACFASGTRVRTARGDVAVEQLLVGDVVVTASGDTRPVGWIGHRHVDLRHHPRPQDVLPVRVRANAVGPDMPARDLILSPDHALFIDGVLIPVRYLINGATIVQEAWEDVTYWHVELDRHDIILADGLPCESYLDTGNRSAFANGGSFVQMHPDFALQVWEAQGCARLVCSGACLEAAQSHLRERAMMLGHATTRDPALVLVAGGAEVKAEVSGRRHRFTLPPRTTTARLVSRTAIPAHMRDGGVDQRVLGVAVCGIRLNGQPIALTDERLRSGWHAHETNAGDAGWRWTDGDADLDVPFGRVLDIDVAMTESYWLDGSEAGQADTQAA